jgi:acetolactate decarboxylase
MKKLLFIFILLLLSVNLFSQKLYQVSYYEALSAGKLDGVVNITEILKHGNTGIGGFHALDGEMIIIDGKCYQIPFDGKVNSPDLSITATFAAVSDFKPQKSISIKGDSNLYKVMDRLSPNPDAVIMLKIHGTFSYIKTRSVPAQKKPYPVLSEIVKTQSVFEGHDISGTVIGMRTPAFISGLNPKGYHLHFLSDDKKLGGHLLEMRPASVSCEVMEIRELQVILPGN